MARHALLLGSSWHDDVVPQQPETFKMLCCAREALVTLKLVYQPLKKWVSDFNYEEEVLGEMCDAVDRDGLNAMDRVILAHNILDMLEDMHIDIRNALINDDDEVNSYKKDIAHTLVAASISTAWLGTFRLQLANILRVCFDHKVSA